MKKYIFNILLVGLLFLGPLYALQTIVDSRARSNYLNNLYRTLNTALEKKVDADVVIFGNSRVLNHFDTQVMDSVLSVKCFNMGLPGFPFDIQYHLVIKPYLHNNKPPKLIIYEISPYTCLEHCNPIYQNIFMPYINSRYYDYYMEICDEISEIDRYLPFKYRGRKFHSFYQELTGPFGPDQGKDSFTPFPMNGYKKNFMEGQDSVYAIERNPQIVSQLREFVKACKKKNVELLFVTTPMHEEDFYNHCHTEEFLSMVDTISNWTNRFNYSLMFHSDTTFFAEPTHLNALGAKVFSKKFAEDVKSEYGSLLSEMSSQSHF